MVIFCQDPQHFQSTKKLQNILFFHILGKKLNCKLQLNFGISNTYISNCMSILKLVGCPYCFYCINDKIIQYVEHENLEYPANLDIG